MDSIFLTSGKESNDEGILWLLSKTNKELKGYNLETMTEAFTYPVLSACKIGIKQEATPLNPRILLLLPDYSLWFWIGYSKLIPCTPVFQINAGVSDGRPKRSHSQSDLADGATVKRAYVPEQKEKSHTRGRRIVDLHPHSAQNIIVAYSDGHKGLGTTWLPKHSSLLDACLHAMNYTLPVDTFIQFYTRLLYVMYDDSEMALDGWESFIVCFFSFLHERLSSVTIMSKKNEATSLDEKASEWLQTRLFHLNRSLPSCVKNRLLNQDATDADENAKSSKKLHIDYLYKASKALHFKFHSQENLLKYAELLMISLHYVYEDFLLDSSLSESVEKLGSFLYQLHYSNTSSCLFGEYYRCNGHGLLVSPNVEFTKLNENKLLGADGACQQPLKIFDWVYNCVSSEKMDPKHPLSLLDDFGKGNGDEFIGLEKIRYVHDLYKALYDSSNGSGAVNLVEYMSVHPSIVELERLPVSVSLSIRQAIHTCKNDARTLFKNRRAYELLGRLDLAALVDRDGGVAVSATFGDEQQSEVDEIPKLLFFTDDRLARVKEIFRPTTEDVLEIVINPSMT